MCFFEGAFFYCLDNGNELMMICLLVIFNKKIRCQFRRTSLFLIYLLI